VNNSTAESEYLMNISSLEHSLNDLITSVKEYMVQVCFILFNSQYSIFQFQFQE